MSTTIKKNYGYEKLYRNYQRKNLVCNVVAGKAVITSVVAGGITLSPIVFVSFTAFGIIVKIVESAKKNTPKKSEELTLHEQSTKNSGCGSVYLRGEPFNEKEFLGRLK